MPNPIDVVVLHETFREYFYPTVNESSTISTTLNQTLDSVH